MFTSIASACIFVAIAAGDSTVITLESDRDATLIESVETEAASGAGDGVFAGRVGASGGALRRRAVLHFSMDDIPSGSTIISATLTLTAFSGQGDPQLTTLHRASAEWGEGASAGAGGGGAPAEEGDATWTMRFWPEIPWSNAGGDFNATASASALAPSMGKCSFASSAALVADVQAWVDDSTTNFGWVVLGNESSPQTVRRFGSRETADRSARPLLTVTYTPPSIPGDVNGDGVVDGADLAVVLGSWGQCEDCAADLNGDSVVDGADLAIVLGNWS